MADAPNCLDCRWWREQDGSAHVMCPTQMDFAFVHGPKPCALFAPVLDGEDVPRDGVNCFIYWGGGDTPMPSTDAIFAWFDAHPEYKTVEFEAAWVKWKADMEAAGHEVETN